MMFGRRVFLSLIFLAVPALAAAGLPARPAGYVTDGAGVLSEQSRNRLDALLDELRQKTGAEIAVVTADSLDGRDVAEAAESLFRSWGIGSRGKDDGLLFLVVPRDRKARIEVGYGLEPLIPDARAGRILDERALPRFRAGDVDGGVTETTAVLAQIIAADRGVQLTGLPRSEGGDESLPLLPAMVVFILLAYLVVRHPWLLFFLMNSGGRRGGPWSGGGGFGGGSFGGFGGGASGGGGASRGW